jgi:hypothetical protein
MGYQMLKGGGKLAVQVGEEVAKRAGALTEEQVMRGAAERSVQTRPSTGMQFGLTSLFKKTDAQIDMLLEQKTGGLVSRLPMHSEPGRIRTYAFRSTPNGPVRDVFMNFTPASNMSLRANTVSTQWTGAAALGHGEIAQQAIQRTKQVMEAFPEAKVHLGGYSMGGGTVHNVLTHLGNSEQIVSGTVFNPSASVMKVMAASAVASEIGTSEAIDKKLVAFVSSRDAIPSPGLPYGTTHVFDFGARGEAAHKLGNFGKVFTGEASYLGVRKNPSALSLLPTGHQYMAGQLLHAAYAKMMQEHDQDHDEIGTLQGDDGEPRRRIDPITAQTQPTSLGCRVGYE